MRASSRRNGAAKPICWNVGRQATINEPAHIIMTEITSEVLRPRRSAILPNSQPPIGRIRNPIAKTSAEYRYCCTVVYDFGKNDGAK